MWFASDNAGGGGAGGAWRRWRAANDGLRRRPTGPTRRWRG